MCYSLFLRSVVKTSKTKTLCSRGFLNAAGVGGVARFGGEEISAVIYIIFKSVRSSIRSSTSRQQSNIFHLECFHDVRWCVLSGSYRHTESKMGLPKLTGNLNHPLLSVPILSFRCHDQPGRELLQERSSIRRRAFRVSYYYLGHALVAVTALATVERGGCESVWGSLAASGR